MSFENKIPNTVKDIEKYLLSEIQYEMVLEYGPNAKHERISPATKTMVKVFAKMFHVMRKDIEGNK